MTEVTHRLGQARHARIFHPGCRTRVACEPTSGSAPPMDAEIASAPSPTLAVYFHGGGMFLGSLDTRCRTYTHISPASRCFRSGIASPPSIRTRSPWRTATPAVQILIHLMLDDRTLVAQPDLADTATWSAADNLTGWRCLLGDAAGSPDTPPMPPPPAPTT